MIKVTKNGVTIVGNNEDQSNPNTRIWFEPGKNGNYGVVYVGFDNLFPQGGMNEFGLVYDGFTQSNRIVVDTVGKIKITSLELQKKIMQECKTVDEVKSIISKYNIAFLSSAVLRYVDKTGRYLYVDGDSLVIGEKNYFVQTNVRPYENKKCWRSDKATRLLEHSYDATISDIKAVMDSIHQETKWGGTLYTTVYDLNNGKVYLYHFYDYSTVVTFDLGKELKKGQRALNIPELFPNNEVGKRYFMEYNRILIQIKQLGDSTMTDVDGSYKTLKNDIANSFIDGYPFYYKISKYAEYYLTERNDYPRAILLLRLNVEIYSDYWKSYDALGEAYTKNKQYQLALNNYLRSVELNPDNTSGKKQIDYLKKLIEK
jgi:tetratricopeptide (TPR) repeat protein